MSKFRGILFDYGHTLVWFPKYGQANRASARNVQAVLRDLGASIGVQRVRQLIESYVPRKDGSSASAEEEAKGILDSAGVEDFDRNDLCRVLEAEWRPYVVNVCIRKGVKEALEYSEKAGLKLGIVANIWSGGMNPVLARFGIQNFFNTTVASMDVGFAKPDPRIFHQALENLQLTPQEAIMVGDNPKTDIKGARDLGMGTVRLMRGPNRRQADCAETNFRIRNPSILPSIIDRLSS